MVLVMDIEEYIKTSYKTLKTKDEITSQLTNILKHYKNIPEEHAKKLSQVVYDEIITTQNIKNTKIDELLTYTKTGIKMGEFGVGSRGAGDFYVHSKIAEIIKNTQTNTIVDPTQQDDGGVVKVDNARYITTAIDGIHSRLGDYPFLAGFHTARATLRDVCVMGANPVALISDIHLADDGDIGKLLDYTAGICAVSELTDVPLISGSTLRIGGDMVLGDRLTGGVGAVGVSSDEPTARMNAQCGDIIIMTEGCGGGTITTTAIYNNHPSVIEKTMNVQFIKAANLLNNYSNRSAIHAMTDITNGGINGDVNEINKTTHLGIKLYEEKILNLIDTDVLNMLQVLDIDPMGVSIDSIMIIADKNYADDILDLLRSNHIRAGIIGEVTDSGKSFVENSDGNISVLTPKFREAAYTPIKKIIDEISDVDFDECRCILDEKTCESIAKKDKIVEKIRRHYE